jgi:phytoene dehydrogenase-like protein
MHLGLLAHYSRGAFFPSGGSGPLRDAFVDALSDCGATLKRNARVKSILHEHGRTTGVQLTDGTVFEARTVISNAQANLTYEMVGVEHLRPRLQKKLRTTEQSIGSIVVFAGVDGDLDTSAVGSSNVWSYEDLDIDKAFGDAAMGDYRQCGSFFLTVPTNKDPNGGLAPKGKQTVELVTLCNSEPFAKWFGTKTKRRGDEYEQLKQDIGDFYLERAERVLPGLRDHLEFRDVATPATNVTYASAVDGNIYGPAHGPGQVFPFRFMPKAPLDGLFLCGASVMSAGVVPCAGSGRDAGKLALKRLDQTSPSWLGRVREKVAPRIVGSKKAEVGEEAVGALPRRPEGDASIPL